MKIETMNLRFRNYRVKTKENRELLTNVDAVTEIKYNYKAKW